MIDINTSSASTLSRGLRGLMDDWGKKAEGIYMLEIDSKFEMCAMAQLKEWGDKEY